MIMVSLMFFSFSGCLPEDTTGDKEAVEAEDNQNNSRGQNIEKSDGDNTDNEMEDDGEVDVPRENDEEEEMNLEECFGLQKGNEKRDEIINDYSDVAEKAMECLDNGFDSVMTVMTLPETYRRYYRTSNHIERLNRELKKFIQGNNTQKTFPEVNIYESKDKYMVLAKIPGVDKKDIQISIKDNALKLSGEIKSKDSNKTYYLTERISGSFKRNFMFDEKIDAEKVFAELKNGILTIDLPKSEDAKPKVITIA